MEVLHLVYQHWFLTILVLACGVAPVVEAVSGFVVALVAKVRGE